MPVEEKVFNAIGILCAGVLFALFPDVDIKSRGQLVFYRVFIVLDVILLLAGEFTLAAYFGLLALVPIVSRHRGWTHSYAAMILVPMPVLLVPMYLADHIVADGVPLYLGAVTGYFSHLLADGLVFRRR